jgi:hypothetical protein
VVKSGNSIQTGQNENEVSAIFRHNLLSVSSVSPIDELTVYDLQGKLVHRSTPQASTKQVSLQGKFYIVRVKAGGYTFVRKVVNY